MALENALYGEEHSLPYLVQLARIDGSLLDPRYRQAQPTLMHLDLRGGAYSRPTTYRLAKTFDWLTRALSIRRQNLDEYALQITPIPPRDDEEVIGARVPYIPEDLPELQKRSFLWVPVAFDTDEENYAWQRL